MRYWHPFTSEAIAQLREYQCEEIVLLPMYPQYSSTTTGSSLNEWNRLFSGEVPVHCVRNFYRNELYLDALIEKMEEALSRFVEPEEAELVFSAHSVPVAVIEKGDPYKEQIEETVSLLMERGGWQNHHRLCYQSKVGASKWLQPTLRDTMRRMGAEGIKNVCIVPISFVSDHVETLGEINHEAREKAKELGFEQFEMTSGLNDSPTFIAALAELVTTAIGRNLSQPRGASCLVAAD
jgi:ferrochelatase